MSGRILGRRAFLGTIAAGTTLAAAPLAAAAPKRPARGAPLPIEEATVADLAAAMTSGRLV